MSEEKTPTLPERNADGSYPPVALPNGSFVDYDSMSEEEYFKTMEKKVEMYKQQFPDMYEKAVKWLEMMNESEIYKKNAPGDPNVRKAQLDKALDIIKNAKYNGYSPDEISEDDTKLLTEQVPDWRKQLEDNLSN